MEPASGPPGTKITITPLLSTLSILNYVPVHSEIEILVYGIGVILLNIGIYFASPAFAIIKLKRMGQRYQTSVPQKVRN